MTRRNGRSPTFAPDACESQFNGDRWADSLELRAGAGREGDSGNIVVGVLGRAECRRGAVGMALSAAGDSRPHAADSLDGSAKRKVSSRLKIRVSVVRFRPWPPLPSASARIAVTGFVLDSRWLVIWRPFSALGAELNGTRCLHRRRIEARIAIQIRAKHWKGIEAPEQVIAYGNGRHSEHSG
jgi:hypothetical protein